MLSMAQNGISRSTSTSNDTHLGICFLDPPSEVRKSLPLVTHFPRRRSNMRYLHQISYTPTTLYIPSYRSSKFLA